MGAAAQFSKEAVEVGLENACLFTDMLRCDQYIGDDRRNYLNRLIDIGDRLRCRAGLGGRNLDVTADLDRGDRLFFNGGSHIDRKIARVGKDLVDFAYDIDRGAE